MHLWDVSSLSLFYFLQSLSFWSLQKQQCNDNWLIYYKQFVDCFHNLLIGVLPLTVQPVTVFLLSASYRLICFSENPCHRFFVDTFVGTSFISFMYLFIENKVPLDLHTCTYLRTLHPYSVSLLQTHWNEVSEQYYQRTSSITKRDANQKQVIFFLVRNYLQGGRYKN